MLEENGIIASQKEFVLTGDLVPIAIRSFKTGGCSFKGPLPLGTRSFFKKEKISSPDFKTLVSGIVMAINKEAERMFPPFQNILLGYNDRNFSERKHLSEIFKISDALIDEDGVYAVELGSSDNAMYLSSDDCGWEISDISALSHLFESSLQWECRYLNSYWQALLAREFAVRYFNILNPLICTDKQNKSGQQKLD